jgi:hypothetical protein
MPFGFVPTDLLLIVPPSHSAQPRLQPTDIHRHVCLSVVQEKQRRVRKHARCRRGLCMGVHCIPDVAGGTAVLARAGLPPYLAAGESDIKC